MAVSNLIELKALALETGKHCKSVDGFDDVLRSAIDEVETVIGGPWTPTANTETLVGDGTQRLQIKGSFVRSVESVTVDDIEQRYTADHVGGVLRPHCHVWPAGCRVVVNYTSGLEGNARTAVANVIAGVTASKAEDCATGKTSETIGSYSVTYADGALTVGDITEQQYRLLKLAVRHC